MAYSSRLIIIAIVLISAHSALSLSECERKRQSSTRNVQHPKRNQTAVESNALIVECNPDGTYAPLQCYGESVRGGRFCLCYDKEGQVVKAPSRKTKKCDCYVEAYEAQRNGKKEKPTCAEDGTYSKVQCQGDSWWCADPNTGRINGKKNKGACSAARC